MADKTYRNVGYLREYKLRFTGYIFQSSQRQIFQFQMTKYIYPEGRPCLHSACDICVCLSWTELEELWYTKSSTQSVSPSHVKAQRHVKFAHHFILCRRILRHACLYSIRAHARMCVATPCVCIKTSHEHGSTRGIQMAGRTFNGQFPANPWATLARSFLGQGQGKKWGNTTLTERRALIQTQGLGEKVKRGPAPGGGKPSGSKGVGSGNPRRDETGSKTGPHGKGGMGQKRGHKRKATKARAQKRGLTPG